ncbi:MAG TPA: hypothetical protein VFY01_09220, partial [Rheinheimera sp.]|nr:hypothetical protein [Rheinheimera sp.]
MQPKITLLLAGLLSCMPLQNSVAAELMLAGKGEIYGSETKTLSKINRNWFDSGTGQLVYHEHPLAVG